MRWRHAATSVAVMMGLIVPVACLDAPTVTRLEIMGAPVVLDEFVPPPPTVLATPDPGLSSVPTPVPLSAPVVMTQDLSLYVMRTADPRDLIRHYWAGTGDVGLMLAIARREAGLGKPGHDPREACAADNPRSSAAGLFQTMGFHRHLAETMAVPEGEPKLTWANVAGPDCWDDVRLAFQLYDHGRGLSNWRPLPAPIPGED